MTAEARPTLYPSGSPPSSENRETFRLRGSNYSLLTLRLLTGDVQAVLPALGDQFRKAPGFLRFAPIAIGLDDLGGEQVDFPALIAGLRALEILPIGVVGGPQLLRASAAGAGLPTLRPAGQRETEVEAPSPVAAPPVAIAPVVVAPVPEARLGPATRTMVVSQNIRAGQRIYAEGCDLIIIGSVNAGSEVLADGNIHIYGALRGRALAGASEDGGARIFAQNFDPELVAISGFYAVREGLTSSSIGRGVQVRLDGEQLRFDAFG